MKERMFFTTSAQEINEIKTAMQKINGEYNESDSCNENCILELIQERNYYNETIDFIHDIYKTKLYTWQLWSENYSGKDVDLFLKEPYFGSVNIKNWKRVYIGKQSLYNICNSKAIIEDWRSHFADLYYSRKKHNFYGKRIVELEDIRNYYNKYYFNDILTSYESTLRQKLSEKKADYLVDIVDTIDEVQNEIIRGEQKKN